MRSSGKGSGGGLGSNKVVRPPYRNGSAARVQNVKGVSQIGQSLGNHATGSPRLMQGVAVTTMGPAMSGARLGSEVAASTVCGPGGSRSVMRNSTQGQHGPVPGTVRPPGRSFDDRGPKR
jgi:hypothetical protein